MVKQPLAIYLEIGSKKVFAAGINWPGWSRSGRDEATARATLVDYAPRYAEVMRRGAVPFVPPSGPQQLLVMERLTGNATTDFGAPNVALPSDTAPIEPDELVRLKSILAACWQALDQSARKAEGKTLRTGPRGGGRPLEDILQHALDAEAAYLRQIHWKITPLPEAGPFARIKAMRLAALDALTAAVENGLPETGPRGGKLWLPRTYLRRSAWHILDHAWEIEDRAI